MTPESAARPHDPRPWYRRFQDLIARHWRTLVVCGALLVILALLEDILSGEIVRIDSMAYWLVVEHMRTGWLTPIMVSITQLASPAVLLVLLVVVAAFAPGRRPGWCCAVNLVLVVVLNEVLKFIVHRPRPDGFRLISEVGYSFPSGHSMVAMAFFGLLIWMVWRYERDRTMRLLWSVFFALVILAVGLSRIYLGVHYASDVIAGFCVSLVWLAAYTRLVAPLFLPKPTNPRHAPRLVGRLSPKAAELLTPTEDTSQWNTLPDDPPLIHSTSHGEGGGGAAGDVDEGDEGEGDGGAA